MGLEDHNTVDVQRVDPSACRIGPARESIKIPIPYNSRT